MSIYKRTVRSYEILSLSPANGISAVYAEESIESPGFYTLVTRPLTHIAIASVVARTYAVIDGKSELQREVKEPNDVVGVDFISGWANVSVSDSNFAGLLMPGGDIQEAATNLGAEYPLVKTPSA
jgi:hypothetical protein